MNKNFSLQKNCPQPSFYFPINIHLSSHKNPGCIFPPHYHQTIEVLYFKEGSARLRCQDKEYLAQQGNIFIINSKETHSCETSHSNLSYIVLSFELSFLSNQAADVCQINYLQPLLDNDIVFSNDIKEPSSIRLLFDEIVHEYEKKDYAYELAIKARLCSLLLCLLRNPTQISLPGNDKKHLLIKKENLLPCFYFIENKYMEKISLQDLAQQANMSREHFCRVFKEITGQTPVFYLLQYRLKKAATLLSTTKFTITQIALQTGFSDSNYFSRQFRKYYKISPSSFKQKNTYLIPRS